MNRLYIEELIEKLYGTTVQMKSVTKSAIEPGMQSGEPARGKYNLYEDGLQMLLDVFLKHKERHSMLFFIGNGGSSAIASHMTADFMKNGGMNTYSLYDNAVTTCMGNDYGFSCAGRGFSGSNQQFGKFLKYCKRDCYREEKESGSYHPYRIFRG